MSNQSAPKNHQPSSVKPVSKALSGKHSLTRSRHLKHWKKSVALLGLGFWASSLALLSPTAQSQSNDTPACFGVTMDTHVYASPSFAAAKLASYNRGDMPYATTSAPTSIWVSDGTSDGNSFIEVAFTNGAIGWTPRYPEGSNTPILIDMFGFEDCPNPGINAAGYRTGPIAEDRCFYVQQATNLYSRPDFGAMIDARYNIGDIAYATEPFNDVPVAGGTNAFIQVDIYGNNKAWVPRFNPGGATILVDYPPEECARF